MVEQGDILKLEGFDSLALVISKDSYNESGNVIACPVVKKRPNVVMSLEIKDGMFALCDHLRHLDLNARGYATIDSISMSKIVYVTDMVQSIFDYY